MILNTVETCQKGLTYLLKHGWKDSHVLKHIVKKDQHVLKHVGKDLHALDNT